MTFDSEWSEGSENKRPTMICSPMEGSSVQFALKMATGKYKYVWGKSDFQVNLRSKKFGCVKKIIWLSTLVKKIEELGGKRDRRNGAESVAKLPLAYLLGLKVKRS